MTASIVSMPHSFVRFYTGAEVAYDWMDLQEAGADLGFSLPVCAVDDIAYQFMVRTDTAAEADKLCGTSRLLMQFKLIMPINSGVFTYTKFQASPAAFMTGGSLNVQMFRLSSTEVLYFVPSFAIAARLSVIPLGACFQIAIGFNYANAPVPLAAVSNVFTYRGQDAKYTTVLEYDSEIDEAGFYYCMSSTIKNRIRLPMYLTRPVFQEEEAVMRMSDGTTQITSASIQRQYKLICDLLDRPAVDALRAVFLHDRVAVSRAATVAQPLIYEGEIVKQGAFELNYPEFNNHPLASVTCNVAATPFLMEKNNCGECTTLALITVQPIYLPSPLPLGGSVQYNVASYVVQACCAPISYKLTYVSLALQSAVLNGTILTVTFKPFGGGFTMKPYLAVEVSCGSYTVSILGL